MTPQDLLDLVHLIDLIRRSPRNCGVENVAMIGELAADTLHEIENLRRENAELRAWVRVVMEETVLAGYPGGDRNQALQNIRGMRADVARLNWFSHQTKEASMRFDDGTFKVVKAWSIAATFDDLRTAIDAAMANHNEPV
jgi:hypothetical protein